MTKTTMPQRMPVTEMVTEPMLDPGRELVDPGLDVAGLETPHQQDQRQEHHDDHQVDGDADDQAELVERGVLVDWNLAGSQRPTEVSANAPSSPIARADRKPI